MKVKMPAHKLVLDEFFEQPFKLFAIHASVEDYRMAFLLNKNLGLRLKRARKDVDIRRNSAVSLFELYEFEDEINYCSYFLVGNVSRSKVEGRKESRSLFEEEPESLQKSFLLPEFRQVDFFLKIEEDIEGISESTLLNQIKGVAQVSMAYPIEFDAIKSKENLIFD